MLAVIGFDTQLDGLENTDRVAAAFYKGSVDSREPRLAPHYSFSELLQLSADRVLQANKLSGQQLAVIVVSALPQTRLAADNHYIRCEQVACFSDAVTLSKQIINKQDIAVLIIAAHISAQPFQQQATISYDRAFNAYGESSGVASVLLSSANFAARHNSYIYAYLRGFAVTEALSQIAATIKQSFASCALDSDAVSSVEVTASADMHLQAIEQNALLRSYKNALTLQTSLSCIKSVVGDNGPLSELLGFINVVFVLQQRYRAAVKAWQAPHDEQLSAWLDSPFYLLTESAPAFPDKRAMPRYVAYSCLSAQRYAHLIVQENNDNLLRNNGFNACSDCSLFIVSGNSQSALSAALSLLNNDLAKEPFKRVAKHYYRRQQSCAAKYRIVLVAESAEQLAKEIALALTAIADAFSNKRDWKTPQGSYFCVNPSVSPKVCFLYPGIAAAYLGLGRDLLQMFPQLYPSLLLETDNIAASLKDRLLNPRSVVRPDFQELKQRDLALRANLADIAECGVGYACVFSRIFTEVLNINADFAAGYSMGEVSMFAALGCWQNPGQMSARLAKSPTFTEQLSGELQTLRSLWQLPATAQGGEKLLWESYNIKATVAQVQAVIQADERVYITLINTADSLVIAGYPADCLAVAKRLGVAALALHVHNAIHSAPAYQQYQQMVRLYSMDLAERIPTKIYSSSCYLPVPFSKKAIAVSIAKCLCEQVDFPRLINILAAQDVSVFIEMGAGRSLCTWTDKILAAGDVAEQKLTVALNAKGCDQQLMMMRAIAKLLSAGAKINLDCFFDGSIVVQVQ